MYSLLRFLRRFWGVGRSSTERMSTEESGPAGLEESLSFLPYEQFILFGDSITEFSCSQEQGFGFHPALQNGKCIAGYLHHRALCLNNFFLLF